MKNDNAVESIRYVEECPLKPLPPRREYADESKVYKAGWNDCIDEILGDENEAS